jgi:hypothetical protein
MAGFAAGLANAAKMAGTAIKAVDASDQKSASGDGQGKSDTSSKLVDSIKSRMASRGSKNAAKASLDKGD